MISIQSKISPTVRRKLTTSDTSRNDRDDGIGKDIKTAIIKIFHIFLELWPKKT